MRNTPKSLNTKYDEYTDNPYVSSLEIWIGGREEREKQKMTQTDKVMVQKEVLKSLISGSNLK